MAPSMPARLVCYALLIRPDEILNSVRAEVVEAKAWVGVQALRQAQGERLILVWVRALRQAQGERLVLVWVRALRQPERLVLQRA